MKYDYLVVGSGLAGAIFAYEATARGKKCLVIDRRNHIGGNLYNEEIEDIFVHKYGAHIFHTSNLPVWQYINQFAEFNHFINCPIANYKGEIYNLPFNMNTFCKLWGISTPAQAQKIISEQQSLAVDKPDNLEEQAIKLVGYDIYQKLIKGYTEKQWGRSCKDLPAFIIKRLPVRFTYDNNYFNDKYQGIPIGGYNRIFEKLLAKSDIKLNTDFNQVKNEIDYDKLIYTGMIDEYFNFCYGKLEYRTLRFEHSVLDEKNYQGVAVVNYTDSETPFTRIIEHKHFDFGQQQKTVITKEYPIEWSDNLEPYYPINDNKNQKLFLKYTSLANKSSGVIFCGRLAQYKYYNMDQIVSEVLAAVAAEFKN